VNLGHENVDGILGLGSGGPCSLKKGGVAMCVER